MTSLNIGQYATELILAIGKLPWCEAQRFDLTVSEIDMFDNGAGKRLISG
jgi:hypothetical protein